MRNAVAESLGHHVVSDGEQLSNRFGRPCTCIDVLRGELRAQCDEEVKLGRNYRTTEVLRFLAHDRVTALSALVWYFTANTSSFYLREFSRDQLFLGRGTRI